MVEDKIADMLTRIRNANQLRYDTVDVIGTKMTCEIARILKEEGYISEYKLVESKNGNTLTLNLKYTEDKKTRVITGLKRISKSGLRVYVEHDKLPRVLNGLGIAIISTSKGIMTDRDARKQNLGGEVLAYIW
jgi:small subunit ribosomal protein S8